MEPNTEGGQRREFLKAVTAGAITLFVGGRAVAGAKRRGPSPEQIAFMKAAIAKKKKFPNAFAPVFDFPGDNPHTLTEDECSYFFVCGPSDSQLTELKFNGEWAEYFEWTVGDEYWWGEFWDVGTRFGAGTFSVSAVNATGPNSITVIIPS